MYKTTVLTLSLLAPFAMLLGTAHAGPKITDKNFFPNEVHAQSGHGTKQRQETDWRRARASASRTFIRPSAREKGASWQYQGGPKLPPVYW